MMRMNVSNQYGEGGSPSSGASEAHGSFSKPRRVCNVDGGSAPHLQPLVEITNVETFRGRVNVSNPNGGGGPWFSVASKAHVGSKSPGVCSPSSAPGQNYNRTLIRGHVNVSKRTGAQ